MKKLYVNSGLKLELKRLSKRSQNLRISVLASLLAILLITFQNCSPVGSPKEGSVGQQGVTNVPTLNGSNSGNSNNQTSNSNQSSNGEVLPPTEETPVVITDNPPPPNPSNLRAPANGNNNITLVWDTGDGSTAGFRVSYVAGTTPPSDCNSGTVMNVVSTSASIAGLNRGNQYSFRVCAMNGNTNPDLSSGITMTWGTRCYQNTAPQITTASFNPVSFPMGMGTLSGTGTVPNITVTGTNAGGPYDLNQTYELRCSSSPGGILDLNCDGNNGRDFNAGSATFSIRQDQDNQCPATGPITITMFAQDDCGTRSATKTVVVNVTNECMPEKKVVDSQAFQNDQFGSDVAIDGNYAVVVETGDNEGGQDSGAANVYFFDGTNWVFQQKLIPTEANSSDNLKSASISGNRIALGSPYHPTAGVGAVFIFERTGSTWVQTAKVLPSEPNVQDVGDLFGYSVSLKGTRLVVGAPWDNNFETTGTKLAYAGAVYVYNLVGSSWQQEGSKITVPVSGGRNAFGSDVDQGTDFIIASAPHDESFKANGPGRVYILSKNSSGNWISSQTLEASDKRNGDMFGASISTDGVRIAVGSMFGNGRQGQSTAGSAYVFEKSTTWSQKARVVASDGNNSDRLGSSISIVGSDLLIGAPWNDLKTGAAYHYKLSGSTWSQFFKVMARDRAQQDQFGANLGLSGRRVIIGSRLDDKGTVNNVGAGYILNLK